MPDQEEPTEQELQQALEELRALPRPAMDFTTPEGAILCLEDAYRRRDLEAAVACKDFEVEAVLLLEQTMPDLAGDEEMLAQTREVLEAGFRKELSENWPDMEGIESFFVERQPGFQDLSIVVVTEISRMPDGSLSETRLRVSKREGSGWRVLAPISEEEEDEQQPEQNAPGGARVLRHERMAAVGNPPEGEGRYREEIARHIETCWGESEIIYEDPQQNYVRLRVHLVPPAAERPFYTLITSGMSDRPMTVPEGAEELRLAELVISLPQDWKINKLDPEDDKHGWPLRWLIDLARFPHQYASWLGPGHTFPNGEPAEPLARKSDFCCWLLASPILCDEPEDQLMIDENTVVHFHSLIPIFAEEMEFALNNSSNDLLDRLGDADVSELLDVDRKNVCA